jgi:hypothetical protein
MNRARFLKKGLASAAAVATTAVVGQPTAKKRIA